MRITSEEIAALLTMITPTTRRPKRTSIDHLLSQVRRSMRTAIDKHMQASMVLLDEAIRFLLTFENFLFTRGLTAENRDFALHITRLRSGILSVRELVKLGQESAALALARVFFEDIEIAMGLAIDPDFSLAYANASKDSDFWSKQIGYGKIYPRVQRFWAAGGADADLVNGMLSHHKELKSFLSGHIHPTSSSAFRAALPRALDNPGMFLKRPLGSLGEHLPLLCLILADEVQMFSACSINMFIRSNPPSVFSDFKPSGEMDDFLSAAHVLQQLIVKYHDPLWQRHQEMMVAWDPGPSFVET